MTEKELIELAKKDKKAFGIIYQIHFEDLFRFVYKRVSSKEQTDDLVSQTFVKAMLNIHKYKYTGAPLKSWLYRIAINEVNMHFRASSKVVTTRLSDQMTGDLSDGLILAGIRDVQLDQLVAGLNALDESLVLLIELRYFEKLRFKEIGEILGINESNAKMKVHRALKKLKSVILKRG